MADELKRVGLVFKADGTVDFQRSLKEINAELKLNYSQFKLNCSTKKEREVKKIFLKRGNFSLFILL